jgi:hypothetical protein
MFLSSKSKNFLSILLIFVQKLTNMQKITTYFVLMTLFLKAQNEIAPIVLDRPDLTESPFLVPKNYFQMESGILFKNDKSNAQLMKLPTALWKYGLTNNFELRLITDFDGSIKNKGFGLSPIWIGFKAPLVEEKGIVPKISIISHLQIPTLASSFYKAKYINTLPYNEELEILSETASWHYWNWIKETSKKSVLL